MRFRQALEGSNFEEARVIETPTVLTTQEQLVAYIPVVIARSEIQDVMGPTLRELVEEIRAQGIDTVGPWCNYHVRLDPEVFDFEVCVPIAEPIAPRGRILAGRLPATTIARTVYHGSYEGLGEAWPEFARWIEARGHIPAPYLWECYVVGPESDPDPAKWRTQLNRPLERSQPSGAN